jgi:L,D-transpeptidase catalytic domain
MIRTQVLFFFTLFFVFTTQAQVWEQSLDTESAPEDYKARPFSESDFQNFPWLKEFKVVIVVNKANEGSDRQTLRLYVDQQLKQLTKVSTGRENYEAGCKPGQEPKKDHCSKRAYWSTTPTGYFDVDEKYFSNLWQTWMPYSVFFESGIATHQAPAGTEGKLGQRASGGCVRMHPNYAPIIFKTVESAGIGLIPKVNRDGSLAKTAKGDVIRGQGYKTLVIVQNIVK